MTALDTAFAATALVAVAGGLLAVTTRHVVHAALWLVVALLGVGLGLGQPLTMSWLVERTPPDRRGSALVPRLAGTDSAWSYSPPSSADSPEPWAREHLSL